MTRPCSYLPWLNPMTDFRFDFDDLTCSVGSRLVKQNVPCNSKLECNENREAKYFCFCISGLISILYNSGSILIFLNKYHQYYILFYALEVDYFQLRDAFSLNFQEENPKGQVDLFHSFNILRIASLMIIYNYILSLLFLCSGFRSV